MVVPVPSIWARKRKLALALWSNDHQWPCTYTEAIPHLQTHSGCSEAQVGHTHFPKNPEVTFKCIRRPSKAQGGFLGPQEAFKALKMSLIVFQENRMWSSNTSQKLDKAMCNLWGSQNTFRACLQHSFSCVGRVQRVSEGWVGFQQQQQRWHCCPERGPPGALWPPSAMLRIQALSHILSSSPTFHFSFRGLPVSFEIHAFFFKRRKAFSYLNL